MKKKLLLVLLTVASSMHIDAQTSLQPYVISSDTTTQLFLNHDYWQALDDENSSFTIQEVQQKPLSDQFNYITKNSKKISTQTTWFRFNLENNTGKNLNISIASDAAQADLYIPDSNGIMHHFLTGKAVSWQRKDGYKKANAIPFTIMQGRQKMIYLKTYNPAFLPISDTLKFSLFNTEKLEKSIFKDYQANYNRTSDWLGLILSGMFFLAGIFNLLLFFSVRRKTYLYFSIFSLCATLSYAAHYNNDMEHVGALSWQVLVIIASLWAFFLFQFVRNYLQVSKYYPRWDKWLRVSVVLLLGEVIVRALFAIVEQSMLLYYNIFSLIFVPVFIIFWVSFTLTIFIFLFKQSKKSSMFLIGILPFTLEILAQLLLMIGALFNVSLRSVLSNSNNFFGYLNGICLLWTAVVISWDLFRQYALQENRIAQEKLEKERLAREKEIQKRELIAQQKIELEKQVLERTSELKQSLENLKSTQAQLIQSEKMASLGELTAGIAHEIQNPLNFVNNFSEVNREMIAEMKEEIAKGNYDEVKLLADDIEANEGKIIHHGKRADAIVKGMLQHSRVSSGQKELIDINALCDEYLRLSYHGLRAKDKDFNAEMKTDFDPLIGKINVVPQDIGRVLLNLFNNAFYAVNKRQEAHGKEYEPSVSVTTKKSGNSVRVTVSDNGYGIPESIKEKIFQPFFTTKPTGSGTGLGLSLSYDIVKAHGGEIKVESKEEEGTTFIIQLPIIFK
ncbi:MAG: ATP-binding protein [Bacteroidota bacterium]|nr:ATP-binding protein [Bacteroidota bacterium]